MVGIVISAQAQSAATGNTLEFDVDGQRMVTATATECATGPAGLLAWLDKIEVDSFHVMAGGP